MATGRRDVLLAAANAVTRAQSNVGYNQGPSRTGLQGVSIGAVNQGHKCDTDCSAFTHWCLQKAGCVPESLHAASIWTGNQREVYASHGASVMAYSASAVRAGDLVWRKGHVAVYMGGGTVAEAYLNEYRRIMGGALGKQASWETRQAAVGYTSWTHIIRFPLVSGATSTTASTTPQVTVPTEEEEIMAAKDELLKALSEIRTYVDGRFKQVRHDIGTCQTKLDKQAAEIIVARDQANLARAHAYEALVEIRRVKKGSDGTSTDTILRALDDLSARVSSLETE